MISKPRAIKKNLSKIKEKNNNLDFKYIYIYATTYKCVRRYCQFSYFIKFSLNYLN